MFSVTELPPPLMTKLREVDTTSAGDISSGLSISGWWSPTMGPVSSVVVSESASAHCSGSRAWCLLKVSLLFWASKEF